MATVCVGIPTRNRPEYVKEALQSVLNQTYKDIRIIVSDNASEKDSALAVERYIDQLNNPLVSYRYQQTDIKEYGQGRYLFQECQEDYFTILHDDDTWEPKFLEVTVRLLEGDPSLDLVTTDQYVMDTEGQRQPQLTEDYGEYQGRTRYREGILPSILEPLFTYGFFPITGTIFRTDSLKRSGLVDQDCGGNYPFEFNLFLRLGERNMKAYFAATRLVNYRFHRTSLRATEAKGLNRDILETYIKLVERRKFAGAMERKRRQSLAAPYRNYAILRFLDNDRLGCYRYLGKALHVSPVNWKVWVYAVIACLFPFIIKPMFTRKLASSVKR